MHIRGKKRVTCTQGVRRGSHTHTRGKKGVTYTHRVRRSNMYTKGSEVRGSDGRGVTCNRGQK